MKKRNNILSLNQTNSPIIQPDLSRERYDIDCSDSDSETSSMMNNPGSIQSTPIRKRVVSDVFTASTESKRIKLDEDLLQDSFQFLEDTQTLVARSKSNSKLSDFFNISSQMDIGHEFEDDPFTEIFLSNQNNIENQIVLKEKVQDIDKIKENNISKPSTSHQLDILTGNKTQQKLEPIIKDSLHLSEENFVSLFSQQKLQKKMESKQSITKTPPVRKPTVTTSSIEKPLDFTQFCENTQVLEQIEASILKKCRSQKSEAKIDLNNAKNCQQSHKKSSSQKNKIHDMQKVTSTNEKSSELNKPSTSKINASTSYDKNRSIDKANNIPSTSKILEKEACTSTLLQKHKSDFWDDELNKALGGTFQPSQYQKELGVMFEQFENTICNLGANKDAKEMSQIEELLEKTFQNPDMISKVLKSAEQSIRSRSDWDDDTLANAVINISVEGEGMGSLIKKALINNIKKNVSPEKVGNVTIAEETKFYSHGSFYGLPDKVKGLIKLYKGIDTLYEWQDECLKLSSIEARKNLVYALPTSGGKTLVAEILILREILCRRKNALFVLPYVAIVQEKVWSLASFAVSLDFLIEEYAAGKGTYPPRKRRRKNSVYIATIEKALGLMNSLIETGRSDEIGLIVIDELHLLGDRGRGSNLEALLAKIIHMKEKIQIIGMSATIGNLPDICKFLKAEVYTNNFRPVELVEYVKCGDELAKVEYNPPTEDDLLIFERRVDYKYPDSLKKLDPDQLGGLVMEVVPKESCLIFCRSKKNCENVALLLSKVVFSRLRMHRAEEKEAIKAALKSEAGSLCEILKISISYGIAYHHSGLTAEERRIIEEGFRQGIISVICCTSTLAAGVNLPAKRVIIRNPYIGTDFINLARYKQMVGRAGRAGYGELGESIIIATPQELPKLRDLLLAPMDIALSSLHLNDAEGLRQFLLSCISLKMASTKNELQAIANDTLMSVQKERLGINVKSMTRLAIKDLFKMGALEVEGEKQSENLCAKSDVTLKLDSTLPGVSETITNASVKKKTVVTVTNNSKLIISKMGIAAIKGGLDLARSHILYEDLLHAQSSLVLFTGLHLMYLVTPYDISEQIKPSKSNYYNLYTQLGLKERQTGKVLGFNEAVLSKFLTNRKITEIPERVLNRFYVTLMLYDLWNETTVYEVARKYDVNRGLIQNLMTSASSFASNVYHFCEVFPEFWAFSLLLKGMSDRLSHCCVRELLPLMKLPSVKQNRAKQLFKAGYKTLQSIAKSDPKDLINNVEYMSKRLANELIAASKLILLERVENLREEAEDVLEGIEL